jgi:hypothetical protein
MILSGGVVVHRILTAENLARWTPTEPPGKPALEFVAKRDPHGARRT